MILYNAKIITQNKRRDILEQGYLIIKDGYIEEIGENWLKNRKGEDIDLRGDIIMPGLINAHVHLGDFFYKEKAKQIDSPLNILKITNKIDEDFGKMDLKELKYKASLKTLEILVKNGITTIAGGQGIEQAEKFKIRFLGGAMIRGGEDFISLIKEIKKRCSNSSLCFPGILIHSLLEVSLDQLFFLGKAIRENPITVMIHLGEFPDEEAMLFKMHKQERLKILQKFGILAKSGKLIVVHGGYLREEEIFVLSKYDVSFVLCPNSSFGFGMEIADVRLLNKYKLNSAIATDGILTNPKLDLIEDVRKFIVIQKGTSEESLYQMAIDKITIEAAHVLGINKKIGSLKKGKCADLLILNSKKFKTSTKYGIIRRIVSVGVSNILKSSMVGGEWVIKDGALGFEKDNVG